MQQLFKEQPHDAVRFLKPVVRALLNRASEAGTEKAEEAAQHADAALSQMVISCAEASVAAAILCACVADAV